MKLGFCLDCFELKMYFVLCYVYVCTILDCFPLIQFLNIKFYLDMYFMGACVLYICMCVFKYGGMCVIYVHMWGWHMCCVCV